MNTMKKLLALLLTLLIAVTMTTALTGCGDKDKDDDKDSKSASDKDKGDDEDKDEGFNEKAVKKIVSAYLDAMLDGDAEGLLKCSLPDEDELWDVMEEEENTTREDLLDTLEATVSSIVELKEIGVEFTYSIDDVEEMDLDDFSEDMIDEFKGADMEVTCCATATVTFEESYEGESETQTMEVTCYKCDGKWYCLGDQSDL